MRVLAVRRFLSCVPCAGKRSGTKDLGFCDSALAGGWNLFDQRSDLSRVDAKRQRTGNTHAAGSDVLLGGGRDAGDFSCILVPRSEEHTSELQSLRHLV